MRLRFKFHAHHWLLALFVSCAPQTAANSAVAATPAAETATPAPETATPAPETATPAPETASPAPETASPADEAIETASKDRQPKGDKAIHEAVPIKGSDLVRGRARVVVNAPITKVRRFVLDFNDYAEFMPHYRQARLLRRRAAKGVYEVYMQVAALKGIVKMWTRIEFKRVRAKDGLESYVSRFLDGNVRDFQAHWRLRPLSSDRTSLELEVFLHPSLPLPDSVINSENLKGALNGVVAMRKRIQSTR